MIIKIWGARGSAPIGNEGYTAVGSDTSCVAVDIDEDTLVIFDGGSGLVSLGNELITQKHKNLHLFLSHMHYDHIIGIPFFQPLYSPHFPLSIYGPTVEGVTGIEDFVYNQLFSQPFFPAKPSKTDNNITTIDLKPGEDTHLRNAKISSEYLNHPGGAMGYRLLSNNKIVCYVSDTEHVDNNMDQSVLRLIQDADVVIYDATYSEKEFETRKGWGHSTPEQGIKLCQAANVKKLVLYHHAYFHDDNALQLIEKNAKKLWGNVVLAKVGMEIVL